MKDLEKKLGYSFKNPALLEQALTHSSYANERRGAVSCNERLEFLGDSVLGMTTAEHLYHTMPDMPEGEMSRVRAELVCEQSLYGVALELGLGACLRLGRGEELGGGRNRPSILADAVEAVLAALYLDGGKSASDAFVHGFILPKLRPGLRGQSGDYKTALQELIQRQSGNKLAYAIIGESGPDHNKSFTAQVSLNGEAVGTGSGRSKKEAEQAAARSALEALQ